MSQIWKQALNYHQQGQLQQAASLYEQCLKQDPNNATVLHLMGICSGQSGQYELALSYLQRALKLKPIEASFHNSLANVYKLMGVIHKAEEHYQQSLKTNPKNPSTYSNLGALYLKKKQYGNAHKMLTQAIQLKPDFTDAHYNLALCQLQKKHTKKAYATIKKTYQLDPETLKYALLYARLTQEQKGYQDALTILNPFLSTDAEHAPLHQQIGCAYLALNQHEQAIACFEKALQLNEHLCEAHHNLGTCYLIKHNLPQARQHWLQVVRLNPEAQSYYNVGVVYQYEERHHDAIHYFNAALEKDEHYFAALINLASIHLKLDQREQAKKYYQKAHQINPKEPTLPFILAGLDNKPLQQQAFKQPPPEYVSQLFDQYAPYFDQHVNQQLDYQTPKYLYEILHNHHTTLNYPHPDTLIDLGCGTGLAAQQCTSWAKTMIGIDLSAKMIEQAEKKGLYTQLIHADILQGLKQCPQVDIIIACDTLPCLGDLAILWQLIEQHLKPNGLFAFTVEKPTQEMPGYHLQKNLRYAHSQTYLNHITATPLTLITLQHVTLRSQYGQPVHGLCGVIQKNETNE
jgi:predicted TPR repeat methyltransferase